MFLGCNYFPNHTLGPLTGVLMTGDKLEDLADVLLCCCFRYRPSLMDNLGEANGTFAINLLKMLAEEDNSRNVFFSPLSISSALAMVLMGAKGNTEAQISQVGGTSQRDNNDMLFFVLPPSWSFQTFTPADESQCVW